MSSVPEILAPAGGTQQLEAAVRSGADAVYLGASSLNARCSAANFTDRQLREAAEYCHIRGVKLYLTLNTLIFDSEFSQAYRIISLACELGIDGIIVQDIGLASYIAGIAPDMRLHASTQCSVQSPSGLRMLARLGFCRAVLARELSREELSALAAASPVELEYFVHGALCMSVSGQCWLSAVIGQRSGNRGRCAQPCRLPFRDGGYKNCLSLKDSSLIPHIGELSAMGIASLKIEGRLKRPEYCAAVTDACLRVRSAERARSTAPGDISRSRDNTDGIAAADSAGNGFRAEDMDTLAAVFSRSGFTDGYYSGVEKKRCGRRDMFGIRTKEDAAASGNVLAGIHALYKNERSRVPVSLKLCQDSAGVVLSASDGEGRLAKAFSAPLPDDGSLSDNTGGISAGNYTGGISAGNNSGGISAAAESKLKKTGGTPYYISSLEIGAGSAVYRISPAEAGRLRREALEKLSEKRAAGTPVPVKHSFSDSFTAPEPHVPRYGQRLDMVFRSAAQIPESFPHKGKLTYGRAYLPLEAPAEEYLRAAELLKKNGIEPALECARGMFGRDGRIVSLLAEKKALGAKACLAHNLGAAQLVLEAGMDCAGGFGLNITNTLSLEALRKLGLSSAEVSFELTSARIRALGGSLPRGAVVYGRLPLMLTRCCPASLEKGCRGLSAAADNGGADRRCCFITDRLGKEFPVICREGCSEVLNTVPLSMSDKLHEFSSLERLSARFTDENADEVYDIIERIMLGTSVRGADGAPGNGITRGLYFRGVE